MKVIVNALQSVTPYKFNCKDCNSTLEADPEDFRYQHDPRDGSAFICKCPICKTDNWINIERFTKTFITKVIVT